MGIFDPEDWREATPFLFCFLLYKDSVVIFDPEAEEGSYLQLSCVQNTFVVEFI